MMRNNAVIIWCNFEYLYCKYRPFGWETQGETPIDDGRTPMGTSDLDGPLELAAELAPYLVGETVAELGEDVLVKDGPHELVVEVGTTLGPRGRGGGTGCRGN